MSKVANCSNIELIEYNKNSDFLEKLDTDVIVFISNKYDKDTPYKASFKHIPSYIQESLEKIKFCGNVDEIAKISTPAGYKASMIAVIGTGISPESKIEINNETLRRLAGTAARELLGNKTVSLIFCHESYEALGAIAEGALYGSYSYNVYKNETLKSQKKSIEKFVIPTTLDIADELTQKTINRAKILGHAVNTTRDFVNQPPLDLYPETFASKVSSEINDLDIDIKIWDDKQLKAEGFGGILGVGKGSERKPRLVKLSYSPKQAAKHLALIGKGITFDTGGISIKPAAGMESMKGDMAGAAAIFSSIVAIAKLRLPLRVTAWLALAENMPSGSAGRPSDVLHMFGGRTVEVLNTDAEGRLVMGDALAAASEEYPDVILDVATLTGAQGIALGRRTSAVMGDDSVRDAIKLAADKAGEIFWPMPLPEELRASLNSHVADIANIGERFAGMLSAGVFLQEFVGSQRDDLEKKIPWAHLDIASPAYNEASAYGYTHKGGTGVAVRTLVNYAELFIS